MLFINSIIYFDLYYEYFDLLYFITSHNLHAHHDTLSFMMSISVIYIIHETL